MPEFQDFVDRTNLMENSIRSNDLNNAVSNDISVSIGDGSRVVMLLNYLPIQVLELSAAARHAVAKPDVLAVRDDGRGA